MKKSLLILVASLGMNALVAQSNPTTGMQNDPTVVNTPATVTNKFKTDNPNISPNWTMDGDNYSATYRDQLTNLDRTIIYDQNGNVIRSDYELAYTSYPKTISDYYANNYPNDKTYKIWSSTDERGKVTYYSSGDDSGNTMWFDKDGKYMNGKSTKMAQKSSTKKSTTSTSNTASK